MNDVLSGLVGKLVQIYSVRGETEVSDTGTLTAYDGQWLCVNRDGQLLYFCISRVRLIKPL